jgi:hypothetical protein
MSARIRPVQRPPSTYQTPDLHSGFYISSIDIRMTLVEEIRGD